MFTFLLVVQAIIAAALVTVITWLVASAAADTLISGVLVTYLVSPRIRLPERT